ncbi:MAG TPA: hypothetical protein VG675_17395 [Bryobacteraceae bacterium]|nr:hypothetical protein [Bryobacteraceae bacterium]
MSVWPNAGLAGSSLSGSEGALVSISIHVDPRDLEFLLEVLSQVHFPINPQIYHEAELVYVYSSGREEAESTTLVEFPAYAGQLDEVRHTLETHGFDPDSVHVTGMLDDIHAGSLLEPAPPGTPYQACYHRKRRAVAAVL